MCVLVTCEGAIPTRDEVRLMMEANDDGAGVAWTEGESVRWYKGIQTPHAASTVLELIHEAKAYPAIFHARLATVGGTKGALTHPFPLGGSLDESGRTRKGVLAHNGHWGGWSSAAAAVMAMKTLKTPEKPEVMSDSRYLAWLLGQMHPKKWEGFVRAVLPGVVVVVEPKRLRLLAGTLLPLREGVMVSNKSWEYSYRASYTGYDGVIHDYTVRDRRALIQHSWSERYDQERRSKALWERPPDYLRPGTKEDRKKFLVEPRKDDPDPEYFFGRDE